jgi:RNA polymerase sigma factor (sigma-70 family)
VRPYSLKIDELVAGDQDAWHSFVDRFSNVIYSALLRTFRSHGPSPPEDRLQDSFQDVLCRLVRNDYRYLRQYDPEKASFPTYLALIARNTVIDGLRKRRLDTAPLTEQDAALPEIGADTPAHQDISFEFLPPRQKLVLHLMFDKEMSVREIADILGIEPQTVRSLKHVAVSQLRRRFDKKQKQSVDDSGESPALHSGDTEDDA